MSEVTSLPEVAAAQIAAAHDSTTGRSALTLHGGRDRALRQTVLALLGGLSTGEHESPGDATIQVLHGRVSLRAGADEWQAEQGDHLAIPSARHELLALEDAAVLLTVAVVESR